MDNDGRISAERFDYIDWDKLRKKTVFITGVTGLVGLSVFKLLNQAEREFHLGLRLVCFVRDKEKAEKRLSSISKIFLNTEMIVGDLETAIQPFHTDYVLHCASVTESKKFVNEPACVMKTLINGTTNVLEFARQSEISGMVYLSSMEVYGTVEKGTILTEDNIGVFYPFNSRDSYPIGKIASEALCHSYKMEYNIPVSIVRLSQVIGEEYSDTDARFPAMLMKCAREKKDIVLKTEGHSERCYISSADAAGALLLILLNGKSGEIYNVADEESYCSIAQLSERVAKNKGIKVIFDIEDPSKSAYPKDSFLYMDTSKLKDLGWKRVAGGIFET